MKEPISKELYDILVCPDCKAKLSYTKDKKALVCKKCKKTYKIEDNIPILLSEDI
ncbi:MAG: Trm112 family protein [Nanoarchaeota archaeon]|nr:Trm112 family protein [Nanoarchaeota archaeon]